MALGSSDSYASSSISDSFGIVCGLSVSCELKKKIFVYVFIATLLSADNHFDIMVIDYCFI